MNIKDYDYLQTIAGIIATQALIVLLIFFLVVLSSTDALAGVVRTVIPVAMAETNSPQDFGRHWQSVRWRHDRTAVRDR